MELFQNNNQPILLDLEDADITYYPNFLPQNIADSYFNKLKKTINWRQDDIKVFGKIYPQPRLTALYASNNRPYSYSNIVMHPIKFNKELLEIKEKIEILEPVIFTTCLLNLYRDGKDSNGWHADNEKELGKNPVIASVSLGQERWFHLKHKENPNSKKKILLTHGSLLIMKGLTQEKWLHQIPKTRKEIDPRINLTYRVIV